jgi:hypothetical protein
MDRRAPWLSAPRGVVGGLVLQPNRAVASGDRAAAGGGLMIVLAGLVPIGFASTRSAVRGSMCR